MIEVVTEGGEVTRVLVGDDEVEILDYNDEYVVAECGLAALDSETTKLFPDNLILSVYSPNGFDTYLFHELNISKSQDEVALDFMCRTPNKYWEGQWGLATFLDAVRNQSSYTESITVEDVDLEDDWKLLTLRKVIREPANLTEAINSSAEQLKRLIGEAEVSLAGMGWREEYETDESLFCTEVLAPLLRRMGFNSVRYRHGTREYGKDFTFSELTPFGHLRNYALQAKAGNISGGVNSDIDELIGQLEDAFSMPYYELGSKDPRYISTFVIAISGRFTGNAKEKIVEKTPTGVMGSVYFLDRESIGELIERYWLKR